MVKINARLAVCLLACAMACTLAQGQTLDGSGAIVTPDTSSFQSRFSSLFDPMVSTGESELGGRKINVRVPGVFDLKLDTRPNNTGMRMSQTVLGGLVQIYVDRTRDLNTMMNSGPIQVKVGGLTMYANQEARNMGSSAPVIPAATLPTM